MTQQAAGIENGALIDQSQERAVCVYVRRVLDERVPAFRCFDTVSPSPPPPPPEDAALLANERILERQRKIREDNAQGSADEPERSELYEQQIEEQGHLDFAAATIAGLYEKHVQLRPLLGGALSKVRAQAEEARVQIGSGVYGTGVTQSGFSAAQFEGAGAQTSTQPAFQSSNLNTYQTPARARPRSTAATARRPAAGPAPTMLSTTRCPAGSATTCPTSTARAPGGDWTRTELCRTASAAAGDCGRKTGSCASRGSTETWSPTASWTTGRSPGSR